MNAKQLRNSILQEAISGRLVPQIAEEGTADELLRQIETERKKNDSKYKPAPRIEKRGNQWFEGDKDITEKIPFEIPKEWIWVRLENITDLITKGASPSWQGVKYVDKGILFITSENVGIEKLLLQKRKYLEPAFNKIQQRSILKKGDILTNIVGASIGRTALFNLDETDCNINQAVALIRLTDFSVAPYLLKVFNSSFVVYQMFGKIVENARANISLTSVSSLLIPLPPLAEQKRIVAKLEEVFPKIEEYGKVQAELDELNKTLPNKLKNSILQYAIQGKLVPQIAEEGTAKDLLNAIRKEKNELIKAGKIKKENTLPEITDEEKPFEIPDSWEWVKLGEIVDYRMGKTPPRADSVWWGKKSDTPWISIADMVADGVINKTKETISKKSVNEIFGNAISRKGTLIMSFKLTVGRVSILNIDATHNEAIISIYPYISENNITRDYLFKLLPFLSQYGESKDAIKGRTLNSNSISNILIPLPPLAEQKRIVSKLEKVLEKVEKLKQ